MRYYFEIIRWKNLLFVVLVQLLMQYAVVYPLLHVFGFETQAYNPYFILLITATVLITAGGYVINDYFDLKIDRINKPDKIIVGESINLPATMRYYQLLTLVGTLAGLILSLMVRSFTLGFIFILTPGLLWFYSASYKRQFLIGNLTVSISTALSVIIVGILAVALIAGTYSKDLLYQTPIPQQIYAWTGGFALFAFLLSMIREIIKDMEDIEGDRELECRTMPIVWGIPKSKIVLQSLILLSIISLVAAVLQFIDFPGNLTFNYLIFILVIPLIILSILILRAELKDDFAQASSLSKLIMLAGVLYSLVFYYLLAKNSGIAIFGLFTTQ